MSNGGRGGYPSSKSDLPPAFVFYWGLNRYDVPSHIGEGGASYQSTDSNVNLFQKHPHRHTQKLCSISYLGIPSPV